MGFGMHICCLRTPRARWIAIIAAIAIAAVAGLVALSGLLSGSHAIDASVNWDSQRFRITNNDAFAWSNVELELNPSLTAAGYRYRAGDLAPGHSVTFFASQLTDRDGKRFDPVKRLHQLRITCDIPGGDKGHFKHNW